MERQPRQAETRRYCPSCKSVQPVFRDGLRPERCARCGQPFPLLPVSPRG